MNLLVISVPTFWIGMDASRMSTIISTNITMSNAPGRHAKFLNPCVKLSLLVSAKHAFYACRPWQSQHLSKRSLLAASVLKHAHFACRIPDVSMHSPKQCSLLPSVLPCILQSIQSMSASKYASSCILSRIRTLHAQSPRNSLRLFAFAQFDKHNIHI